ncbi:MAG: AraC family transcriptional regulator [Ruminococcaceae bacterium]|nr:AraC family transcriptional regulator [Oscillospiraceae bacterium]
MHQNLAYHRILSVPDNVAITDQPLIVNCAGCCSLGREFITDHPNGRNDYYIQYMVNGAMDTVIDGRRITMMPGDAAVYYPHTHYHYEGRPDTAYYWVHFTGSEAERLLSTTGLTNRRILHLGDHRRLRMGFEQLFADFVTRDRYFDLSLSSALTKLCLDMARIDTGERERGASDARLDQILEVIHRDYDRPLSVEELAAGQYLSAGRRRVLFHRRFGMSPLAYINALRINAARQLLESPDMTISEVAHAVGFSDPLYFSKLFRKQIGLSPTEYRKQ